MIEWIQAHRVLLTCLAASSILMFFGTLFAIPLLVVRIPNDYFARDRRRVRHWDGVHPVMRIILIVAKNVAGYVFILAGIAMLVLPGQGLITIFIGITFVDFPGKYYVERWAVQLPAVLYCINWLRKRAEREPLVVEKESPWISPDSASAVAEGVTVFLPLYNEEDILAENVRRVLEYLAGLDLQHEVVLGSNGSTDRTCEIGEALANEDERVMFFHIGERGPGRAFARALRCAKYSRFICLDADLSIEMAFVGKALESLEVHDAVVGSKYLGSQKRPLYRIVASEVFIFLSSLLMRMPYRDYSIGAKAYRTEAVLPFVDKVDTQTFYTQEMIYQLQWAGARIAEIPVFCEDHRRSRFNLLREGFYRYGRLFDLWFRSLLD